MNNIIKKVNSKLHRKNCPLLQVLSQRNFSTEVFGGVDKRKSIINREKENFATYSSHKIRKTQNEHLNIICQNLIGL